jgi:hypothetical protein
LKGVELAWLWKAPSAKADVDGWRIEVVPFFKFLLGKLE